MIDRKILPLKEASLTLRTCKFRWEYFTSYATA